MSREAPIQAALKKVASWTLSAHYGPINVAANTTHDIATLTWKARQGCDYLVHADLTGFINTNNLHRCDYGLVIGTDTIAKHDLGIYDGTWDGLLSVPVQLVTVYRAPADADVSLHLQFWAQADWSDWLLDETDHSVVVHDLGAA